ncbi:MAG: PKD domain-containing protein [Bacteroidia bacterium]|nr:PKD domain-containing protein [Bacteroidia bacterium]
MVIYDQAGDYTVSVAPGDENGRLFDAPACSLTLRIRPYAGARFSANTFGGCVPLKVEFDNQSIHAASYVWDFDDGTPVVTDVSPVHTFLSPGVYRVRLTAFGGFSNDADTVSGVITVFPRPTADFNAVPTRVRSGNDSVRFNSNAKGAVKWFWDFGDGSTSQERDPVHFYPVKGKYTVTLTVENPAGCRDTVVKADYIHKMFNVARDESTLEFKPRLYPNPNDGRFTLSFHASKGGRASAVVEDVLGRNVATIFDGFATAGDNSVEVALALPPGAYLLRLKIGENPTAAVAPFVVN